MPKTADLLILLLIFAGCHTPYSISITNNLSVSVSEKDQWDLFALLEQSFADEIESIVLDTVHGGTPVAIIRFAPKPLDGHTFEYGTCYVWHEDWQGGWGRVLDVKRRKGKWYSDLQVRKTIKWKFELKADRFLIPVVMNATYDEIRHILKQIEDGQYQIAEPESNGTQVEIDWSSVIGIEKIPQNGDVSYRIWTRTGRFQGSTFKFIPGDGNLYFVGEGMWME